MKKRSSNLRLTLMVAAAPAVLLLSGCEEPANTGLVLQTESQCDYQTDVPKDECHAAYQKALADHQRVAPQFADRAQCNDQFGGCTEVRDAQGTSSWVAPMTGFLLGYAASSLVSGASRTDCQRYPSAQGCGSSSGSGNREASQLLIPPESNTPPSPLRLLATTPPELLRPAAELYVTSRHVTSVSGLGNDPWILQTVLGF